MRGTPIWLVVLSMDFCSRTFGTSPCLATGEKCYNTYPTCKYKSAYANAGKDYKFTSADAPAPFDLASPLVKSVRLLPTEIKTTLTVSGRVTVEFLDVPGTDVGVDPYLSTRAAFPNIPGTFWRRWLARNVNYKGRRIKVYEGWLGETEGQFDLRWTGKLENVSIDRGAVKIEAVDLLKDLSKIEVPPKLNVKLMQTIDAAAAEFIVTPNVSEMQSGATEQGGNFVDAGLEGGTVGADLSGAIWSLYGSPSVHQYTDEQAWEGNKSGKITGHAAAWEGTTEATSGGMNADGAELRIALYCPDTTAYRSFFDKASQSADQPFYVRFRSDGQIDIFTDRSATGYTQSNYTVVGSYSAGQTQLRVVLNFTAKTYRLYKRSVLGDPWSPLKSSSAPDYDIPMRGTGSIAQTTGCGVAVYHDTQARTVYFDSLQYADGGIVDVAPTMLVEEELISYSSYAPATGLISGALRGQYGTAAVDHDANQKVGLCRIYAKQNGFDLLKSMLLSDGGILASEVDTAAFDYHRDYPARDLDLGPTVVSEPTKLSILYFELADLLNAKSWQNEANKITVARDVASIPLATTATLSDADTVLAGGAKIDHNEKSRLSRVWLYWKKAVLAKPDEQTSYGRIDLAVSRDSEAPASHGEVAEKKILSRWLDGTGEVEETVSAFARNVAGRMLVRNIEASPIVSIKAALKDEGIKTGEFVALTTDEIVDAYGNPTTYSYQVVKRERGSAELSLSLLRASTRRIGHAAPSGYSTSYASASEADRRKYLFAAGSDGLMSNYDPGYYAY